MKSENFLNGKYKTPKGVNEIVGILKKFIKKIKFIKHKHDQSVIKNTFLKKTAIAVAMLNIYHSLFTNIALKIINFKN